MVLSKSFACVCGLLVTLVSAHALQGPKPQKIRAHHHSVSLLQASRSRYQDGRPRQGPERSKRQERVGQLVQTELSSIIHHGVLKGDSEYLDEDLRRRISVVNSNISPDLRQARISVSIRKGKEESNPAVDKRRAYAWLVRNTKPIRHALAQRMSHMKTCPNLTFVQVDVAAATDVMYLIDKVAAGYKRENIDNYDEDIPRGVLDGIDFDDEDDDDDWLDEDDLGP